MSDPGPPLGPGQVDAAAYVQLRAGEARFALPVEAARRVVPLGPAARLPGTPDHVAGAMNVEGRVVAVWDLARCAGVGRVTPDEGWVLLVEHEGRRLGLLVDAVEDVHRIHDVRTVAVDTALPIPARRFVDGRLVSDGPAPVHVPEEAARDMHDHETLLARLHSDALGDHGLLVAAGDLGPRAAVHLGRDDPPVHRISLDRLTDPHVMGQEAGP